MEAKGSIENLFETRDGSKGGLDHIVKGCKRYAM